VPGILFTSIGWGNLGLRLNDTPEDVTRRRENLRKSLSLQSLVFMKQTHSNRAELVDGSIPTIDSDAIVTSQRGVGLAVLVGDCLPILLRSAHGVAAIHAGRVGMVNGIVASTLSQLRSLGESAIDAIIGPSICADCYEVSPEMYEEVVSTVPAAATNPQVHQLNLQAGVTRQLANEGVEVLNMGICTKESADFYSHRRSLSENLAEGRQVGVIYL
jgi:YfiH family protein